MRQEIQNVLSPLGLTYEQLHGHSRPSRLVGVYHLTEDGGLWLYRNDETQYIHISGREVEVQYTDESVEQPCPAKWPKHLRHSQTFTGHGWTERMRDYIASHVPELG